jgi:hypothetical protein
MQLPDVKLPLEVVDWFDYRISFFPKISICSAFPLHQSAPG